MLRDHLTRLRTLEDITNVFCMLGYEPDATPYLEDASVVGRWKGFRVVAIITTDTAEVALRLARAAAQSASPALVVALNPPERLSIAAPRLGGPGITRVLHVSLQTPSADSLELLARLRPRPRTNGLQHAIRVDDLLTGEAVSQRFYTEFRKVHATMADSITQIDEESDRRMFALITLIRVLFLYFVQAKGWLDHQKDFLRRQFDHAISSGANFHSRFLKPLFFRTLNTPVAKRRGRDARKIPYLNGGLFEPTVLERRWPRTTLSNAHWQTAFEDLFDRFRFCVVEASEVDAIAPDMLGRVFERVMAVDMRHATGTYYTPESIVQDVVGRTLQYTIAHLARIPVVEAERALTDGRINVRHKELVTRALDTVRVLDPAVGSGAFLLGALDALTRARRNVSDNPRPATMVRIRKRILRENLFGVDLNPVAVKLAELRLWLAVIADDPTRDTDAVEPLPNLDGIVRQGDSLIDPVGTVRVSSGSKSAISQRSERVMRARQAIFDARGNERKRVLDRLRREELAVAQRELERAITSTTSSMRDLASVARGRDLFGHRSRLRPDQQLQYRTLKQDRLACRKALTAVREGTVPFFSYEVHTPDVMMEGGFTTVVGNPPWIRAERLPPNRRTELRQRFSWWQPSGERGFRHLPDASVAFAQRAVELTRPGGTVGLLLPSKIASASYAECARRGMAASLSFEYLHRLAARKANEFQATTYPMVLIARKADPTPPREVMLDLAGNVKVDQERLLRPGPWILVGNDLQRALDELLGAGKPLRGIARARLGIKSGADRVFLGSHVKSSSNTITLSLQGKPITLPRREARPVVRGRDIKPFTATPSRWIVWGHDRYGRPRGQMSGAATRYFQSHRRTLEMRTDYTGGPLWSVFRVGGSMGRCRVVWADIVKSPCASVLGFEQQDVVPMNTSYLCAPPNLDAALVIAAVMNSTWIKVLVSVWADEARGGYRRMNARVADVIPIPTFGATTSRLCELSSIAHESQYFEQEALDTAVADCLGLSAATRKALRRFTSDHG